ncbi:MAG: carboxylesterase family protein [Planctomycetes bacterium]|nr:carboxylesterase family protein [Planctomycetota bacterium]
MKSCLTITILLFCMALPAGAADERASQNNDRAKKILKRFPDADLNGDGILTREEFREYKAKNKRPSQGNRSPKQQQTKFESARNVAYGNHDKQTLDVYWNKELKNAPIVINIHGGGWKNGDKAGFGNPKNQDFFIGKFGCVLVSPNYRLTGDLVPNGDRDDKSLVAKGAFDGMIVDVFSAVAFVQKNAKKYGGDPKRIIVCGTSAGAHLSAALAYCGGHDWLKDTPYAGTKLNIIGWYGDSGPLDKSVNKQIPFPSYGAPIDTVKKDGPPALMVIGTGDKIVPVANAYNFQAKCNKLGVWNQIVEMKDGPHAVGRAVIGTNPEVIPVFDAFMKWIIGTGSEPGSGKVHRFNILPR